MLSATLSAGGQFVLAPTSPKTPAPLKPPIVTAAPRLQLSPTSAPINPALSPIRVSAAIAPQQTFIRPVLPAQQTQTSTEVATGSQTTATITPAAGQQTSTSSGSGGSGGSGAGGSGGSVTVTLPDGSTAQIPATPGAITKHGLAALPWWAWALGGVALIGTGVVVKKVLF